MIPSERIGRWLESPAAQALDRVTSRAAEMGRSRPALDHLMYLASDAGDFSLLWHGIAAVRAWTDGRRGAVAAGRLSTTLLIEAALVNGLLKSVAGRQRPEPVATSHELRRPLTSSFPSGHASAAACAALLLSDDCGHAVAWTTLAALVSWSRVHVGIHHGTDVAAGALCGLAVGAIARRCWPLP